jgi:hypothetical protein
VPMPSDTGSFRDPAGQVFLRDSEVYRCIFPDGMMDYEAARNQGIHRDLIAGGQLIDHEEVLVDFAPAGAVYCLHHPRLPFVSYPWEWPFSMFKDAALLHLQVMEYLIPRGFWLRDASAFNAQHDSEGLRLIDTLSIGRKIHDSPWVAYSQFCSHFLAPIAIAAYRDIRLLGLWRNHIDGFPLDLAVGLLPFLKRYRPSIFMHLTLHSQFQQKSDQRKNLEGSRTIRSVKMSDEALLRIIRSLRACVEGINWRLSSKIWASYDTVRTYEERDVSQKTAFVSSVIDEVSPSMVWDLGGNTGEFSLIAAEHGAFVVSIDGDPGCTEYLYRKLRSIQNGRRVLPLTMDLANPSPGLGWASKERLGLADRGPADFVLALALIHHLALAANVPLARVGQWFASLGNHLIVEFVPPSDPMVRKLTLNRPQHLPYSFDVFLEAFGASFHFARQHVLPNGRMLFYCQNKAALQ